MIPVELLGLGVMCFILLAIGFFLLRFFGATGRGKFELEETLGTVDCLDVAIAFDGRRRFVELTVPQEGEDLVIEMHHYLTASHASLLARWLRDAAAPGRTLEEARKRNRKAANVNVGAAG
jgi:hypothetical protein